MRYYPVFLDLRGQRCLVVGEGALAEEKVAGLRLAGAEVRRVASAEYRPGMLAGARLVFDASDDADVNAAVWAEAEAAGILVNLVDQPERCRFIAPALVNRDPLLIAISTSGESPFIASALRARLERQFGAEWGPFLSRVGEVRRRLRARGVSLGEQTRVYRRLLRSPLRGLVRSGRMREAGQLALGLESQAGAAWPGRVALVGAGPGDPSLLTLAAVEQLAEADVVFHDALVSPEVLALCGPQARLVDVGKRGGRGSAVQEEITRQLIEAAQAGHEAVRLKGGDPFIFGRGGEELSALLEAGVEVVVVPGVSSATAAPAVAGIPLTLRGVASSVSFATAKPLDLARLAALARSSDTVVLLMGLAELPRVVEALLPILGPGWPAAVVASATMPSQKVIRAPLGGLAAAVAAAGLAAPATIVIGQVAAASAPVAQVTEMAWQG